MFCIRLDTNSPYTLRWPRPTQPAQVIKLAQAFVAFDGSLSTEEQSPFLADLNQLLEQALPVTRQRISSETERTIAAEKVKRLDEEAQKIVRLVKGLFAITFAETPEEAEKWGFTISQRTGNILLPHNRQERLLLLDAYIAAEEKRPLKERFSLINFDQVRRVRDELKTNLTIRDTGHIKRVIGTAQRQKLAPKMLATLKLAGTYLLVKRFDVKLTPELRKWGFNVVKR